MEKCTTHKNPQAPQNKKKTHDKKTKQLKNTHTHMQTTHKKSPTCKKHHGKVTHMNKKNGPQLPPHNLNMWQSKFKYGTATKSQVDILMSNCRRKRYTYCEYSSVFFATAVQAHHLGIINLPKLLPAPSSDLGQQYALSKASKRLTQEPPDGN